MDHELEHIPMHRPEYAIRLEEGFRRIGVGRTTGYRLLREGRLPTVLIYGRRLIRVADLEAFVSSLAADPAGD